MAQQNINIGTSANKGDGDPIRTAFTKVNANFTELYAKHDGTVAQKADVQGSVYGDDSTVLIDGVSNKVNLDGTVKGNIIPDTNVAYDIGSSTKRFKDLYLSGNTIHLGTSTLSVDANGNFAFSGGLKSNNPIVGDDSTLLVDTANSSIPYAVLSGAPTIPSTTDNITEGTNLYYTDVRADARADLKITALQTAGFDGDIKGSVFADDSTLLVDGVNSKIIGPVETSSLRTSERGVTLGNNAQGNGTYNVSIGNAAISDSYGVAIGMETQADTYDVNVGAFSGKNHITTAHGYRIAVGAFAQQNANVGDETGIGAIAIGTLAGDSNQGANAVAIGRYAGRNDQAAKSIVINATDSDLENTTTDSLVIKPIRNTAMTTILGYDATSGEIMHNASIPGYYALADWKTLIAASTDFADFQTRVAAL